MSSKVVEMGETERMLACRVPTAAPAKYALPLTAVPASRVAIFPTVLDLLFEGRWERSR